MHNRIGFTPHIIVQTALLTTSRTFINTGWRMIYPLLPVFARGVDVEITTLASIIAVIQLFGLTAPFWGAISERQGRKFTILLGLSMYVLGTMMVFIFPSFIGLSIAFLVMGVGKIAFDPAVQAYIGDRVPYERRGMYLGIVELAWSGGFLLIPVMTWLIARYNWQAPFAALAIAGILSLIVAWFILEADKPVQRQHISFVKALRVAVSSRMAIAGLVLGMGISAANQLVSVVFGSWIEVSFGIQLSALAAASAVIGVSELIGEGVVTGFSDRFGKKNLIIIGIVGNIIACFILPFSNISLVFALAGLFFFYLTFELALVATIPLITEIQPEARAMYLTVYVAAVTFGRAVFTPISAQVFSFGLLANCLIAAALNGIALVAIWRFIDVEARKKKIEQMI